jgi:hypothetical protein
MTTTTSTPSNSCATNPSFSNLGTLTTGTPTSVGQAWSYSTTPGNCTYTCINGYSGNNCSTAAPLTYATLCSAPDIQVGSQYWAACNVGASAVSTSYQAGANDSPVATETTAGKYFQWGENVAWTYAAGTASANNCTWNRDTATCGSSALSAWSSTVSDTTSG